MAIVIIIPKNDYNNVKLPHHGPKTDLDLTRANCLHRKNRPRSRYIPVSAENGVRYYGVRGCPWDSVVYSSRTPL